MRHWLIYYKAGCKEILLEGNTIVTQRGSFDFNDLITQIAERHKQAYGGNNWKVTVVNMIEIKGGIHDTTSI